LVNRLRRANVAQFWWPVGGKHDERNARIMSLDDGRHKVSGGGARCGEKNDRMALGFGQAERKGKPPTARPGASKA